LSSSLSRIEDIMVRRAFRLNKRLAASGRTVPMAAAVAVAALALGAPLAADAAVTFRLDRLQAGPGETVKVEAMLFNEGNGTLSYVAPRELVLQWRNPEGGVVRSRARLEREVATIELPAGRFSRVTWTATVPQQVKGLQAVNIEGEPVLLALDATTAERGTIASTPAVGPIIDADKQALDGKTVAVVPDSGVLSGVSATSGGAAGNATVGPAPTDAVANSSFESSTLDRFRSALSSNEPVYFSLGGRGDLNAKFQISLKYRFFQPTGAQSSGFRDNLYFGYTQTSIWDLGEESAPFRDSSYRPSFFWLSDRIWESENRRFSMGFDGGFEHESNGKEGTLSRAVNTLYARPALRYRLENGSTLSIAPKVRTFLTREGNRDITDYRGHTDYQIRWAMDDGPMVSSVIRRGDGRGSLQFDVAYPLRGEYLGNLNGFLHLQYFNGYGETLLDYNRAGGSQFRIGLMIVR
jgi:outer membrane phospholipase A